MPTPDVAFDATARTYDEQFSATAIGTLMRSAVWARCAARFAPGSRVLEMNCGTGEDAVWLANRGVDVLATDISTSMLQVAAEKAAKLSAGSRPRFQQLAWEDLAGLKEAPFDGLLSNFGGLNCVSDLPGVARAMAGKLRPKATALLCIMGPVVPWEWVWFLAHRQPSRAFRRLRSGRIAWRGIDIHYPPIRQVRRACAKEFRTLRVSAIGALLPPPYTETWIGRHPRMLRALERVERRWETQWPMPLLADHYLMEIERL